MSEKALTVQQIWGMRAVEGWRGNVKPIESVNNDLIAGLELEIENLPHGLDHYMGAAGRFWTVVEDGSLRPRGQAWEFVSKPAPLNVLLGELTLLINKLKLTQDNYSDRCSVHIHTNVQDFTQEQLANLSLIYPVFEEVLFQYVNHYKKLEEQGYCRDTNLYCIPWSSCRMNRRFIATLFSSPDTPVKVWQKYTALNLLPIRQQGTVEWRHMHGTCDMEKLTTWINMIGAIMKFCKNTSFEEIVKTITVMNDVSTYRQFFESVLLNTLPYEESYRALLREGILNAKYSLINYDPKKGVSSKKQSPLERFVSEREGEEDTVAEDWAPQPILRGGAAAGQVRFTRPGAPEPVAMDEQQRQQEEAMNINWTQMMLRDRARREEERLRNMVAAQGGIVQPAIARAEANFAAQPAPAPIADQVRARERQIRDAQRREAILRNRT